MIKWYKSSEELPKNLSKVVIVFEDGVYRAEFIRDKLGNDWFYCFIECEAQSLDIEDVEYWAYASGFNFPKSEDE